MNEPVTGMEAKGLPAKQSMLPNHSDYPSGSAKKYQVAMGNPPYTVSYGEETSGAGSLYQFFFMVADEIASRNSIISPARWFNSPKAEIKSTRTQLWASGYELTELHYTNQKVFPTAEVNGGLSWYLRETHHAGLTKFFIDKQLVKESSTFDHDGLIGYDEASALRLRIWSQHSQPVPTNKMVRLWKAPRGSFTQKYGTSNESYFGHSKEARQDPTDIKMRMTNGSWRYFESGTIHKSDFVPSGKIALVFSAFAHDVKRSYNDRTIILLPNESAKGSMAVIFDDIEQVMSFYKYARTKFFTVLAKSRVSGHNAYTQVYQDVPLFSFTENDPIDWSLSIPEIDEQLIAHFGLEDYREYILSASKPYARALGQEYLDRLTEANVDTSRINEWYDD